MAADERLVVTDGITVLVVLHEKDMRNIELPSLVLRTELGRLAENFLHHRVIMLVPVNLSLHHKNRDVLVEGEVILL